MLQLTPCYNLPRSVRNCAYSDMVTLLPGNTIGIFFTICCNKNLTTSLTLIYLREVPKGPPLYKNVRTRKVWMIKTKIL